MPRQARLDIAGALHHIMVRGNNKSAIFKDHQDKARFLERLGQNVIEGQCSVYAWVLMDNHVHLLFKSGKLGISSTMRKLLTWYAQYFNRRHKRTGHLFENRYKSILCDEDNYLLALIRYIHLNPVRANIVRTLEELDDYSWTGHRAVMGKTNHEWMDTDYVLNQFGSRKRAARNAYHRFIAEGMSMGHNPEFTGGGLIRSKGGWSQVLSARRTKTPEESDERILGGGDFVNAILKETEEKTQRQMKIRRRGKTIASIIDEACRKAEISPVELKNGGRRKQVSVLRMNIATRCIDELGSPLAEIARHVGVNTSSIAKAIVRAKRRS